MWKKTGSRCVHLQSKFTLLQSNFFPAKFFFCILEKEILAGKKFTLQKSEFAMQRRLFEKKTDKVWRFNSSLSFAKIHEFCLLGPSEFGKQT
jgi:hypothetical protein